MEKFSLREARSVDAAALGALHVASWRETYPGLLPDQMLARLSPEARAAMWLSVLDDPAAFDGTRVFVAESGGAIVGFGACSRQRDATLEALGFDGEIGAIYILQARQRTGLGRALMRMMALRLRDEGRRAASLWVLRGNTTARAFYERLGAAVIAEKKGHGRTEVAYGWSDLLPLTR